MPAKLYFFKPASHQNDGCCHNGRANYSSFDKDDKPEFLRLTVILGLNLTVNREFSAFEIKYSKAKLEPPKSWVEHYGENYQCITRDNFLEFVL